MKSKFALIFVGTILAITSATLHMLANSYTVVLNLVMKYVYSGIYHFPHLEQVKSKYFLSITL